MFRFDVNVRQITWSVTCEHIFYFIKSIAFVIGQMAIFKWRIQLRIAQTMNEKKEALNFLKKERKERSNKPHSSKLTAMAMNE